MKRHLGAILGDYHSEKIAALLVGTVAIYLIAFAPLAGIIGPAGAALSILPIIFAAWFFGLQVGLIASIIAFPFHVLLLNLVGNLDASTATTIGGLAGTAAIVLLGLMFGRIRLLDLKRSRLERDVMAHEQTEALLLDTNVDLEKRVMQRTAELQRAKDRMEAILNHSSDGIVLVNPTGAIEQANAAFKQLFEQSEQADLYGRPLWELVAPECEERLQTALNNAAPGRVEMTIHLPSGTDLMLDAALSPILDSDGRLTNLIISLRDITQRKQMEDNLRRSFEHERELGQLRLRFVGAMSHSFRTPLTIIRSASDALLNYADQLSPEQTRTRLEKIAAQVDRMDGLLEEILATRQAEAGTLPFHPERNDLYAFCQSIIDSTPRAHPNQRVLVNKASDYCEASFDPVLMGQVMRNLLTNALKFSRDGGSVEIRIDCQESQNTLVVSDQGIGIPEADLPHIYDSFYRGGNAENITGTGLGLTIVKFAVEMHGGTIECDSVEQRGTVFTLKWKNANTR